MWSGKRGRRAVDEPAARPRHRRALHVGVSSRAGTEAESIEMPGGAFTESEIVACGGRSFGVWNEIVRLDAVLDERRLRS